jgi:NAD(P)-dependent dehydrogenase (short-subunit alcohol dehydrogenase family)
MPRPPSCRPSALHLACRRRVLGRRRAGAGRRDRAREPALDILVNNAGAAWGEDLRHLPGKGWDKVVDLNMKAPFFLTQACTRC